MAKYSKKAGEEVKDAMHEMKQGKLKSGQSGKKVTSRKQAIAIGLSEAREKGAIVPSKGASKSKAKSVSKAKSASKAKSVSKVKRASGTAGKRKTKAVAKSSGARKSAASAAGRSKSK